MRIRVAMATSSGPAASVHDDGSASTPAAAAATANGGGWSSTTPAATASTANGGTWWGWQSYQGWGSDAALTASGGAASTAASGAAAAEGAATSYSGTATWNTYTAEEWRQWRWGQTPRPAPTSWWGNGGGSAEEKFERDDNDVPSWDGNLHKLPLLDYFRKIDLWVAQTRVGALRQGPKLLMKLEGTAFTKLATIKPQDLKVEDGVQKFKDIIRAKFEPVETYRVGKVMDAFLYSFSRKPEEEIADYDDRFH